MIQVEFVEVTCSNCLDSSTEVPVKKLDAPIVGMVSRRSLISDEIICKNCGKVFYSVSTVFGVDSDKVVHIMSSKTGGFDICSEAEEEYRNRMINTKKKDDTSKE